MKHGIKISAIALLYAALSSQALTLERIHAGAMTGQFFNATGPVQMDAGFPCFDVKAFLANARPEASRVRIPVKATAPAQLANFQILPSAWVDGPVVTLNLHTGCWQQAIRRHVISADLSSEVLASLASQQTVWHDAVNNHDAAKTNSISSSSTPTNEKKNIGQAKGRSGLTLDPLELLSDRIANLDSFMDFVPTEGALLGQKTLLQKAEPERFSSAWVYTLAALLLLSLLTLLYLWSRLRQVQAGTANWWDSPLIKPEAALPSASNLIDSDHPTPRAGKVKIEYRES